MNAAGENDASMPEFFRPLGPYEIVTSQILMLNHTV